MGKFPSSYVPVSTNQFITLVISGSTLLIPLITGDVLHTYDSWDDPPSNYSTRVLVTAQMVFLDSVDLALSQVQPRFSGHSGPGPHDL